MRLRDLADQGVLPDHGIQFPGNRSLELLAFLTIHIEVPRNQLLALLLEIDHCSTCNQQIAEFVGQRKGHRMADAQNFRGKLKNGRGRVHPRGPGAGLRKSLECPVFG